MSDEISEISAESYSIFRPILGDDVRDTAQRMVLRAQHHQRRVTAQFNGILLTAHPDATPDAIVQEYHVEANRCREAFLNSPEYLQQQREAAEARQLHAMQLQAALAAAPPQMTLRDTDGWQKWVAANADAYGSGMLGFAERWARLMEAQMAHGETLDACAQTSSREADSEGITGYMYGVAVRVLAEVWIHGEPLRRWHNLATQMGDEGEAANAQDGVLNPALLNIGYRL